MSPHSSASSPDWTAGRWLSRGSARMSSTLPEAPALGSVVPKTTRGTRASTIAPAHMAHGSSVTYSTESSTRQLPRAWAAARRAIISAWAVGSSRSSRSLWPAPITSPSWTTMAPTGMSSCSSARDASRSARRMKYSSRGKKCGPDTRVFMKIDVLLDRGNSLFNHVLRPDRARLGRKRSAEIQSAHIFTQPLPLALLGLVLLALVLACGAARARAAAYVPDEVIVGYR